MNHACLLRSPFIGLSTRGLSSSNDSVRAPRSRLAKNGHRAKLDCGELWRTAFAFRPADTPSREALASWPQ